MDSEKPTVLKTGTLATTCFLCAFCGQPIEPSEGIDVTLPDYADFIRVHETCPDSEASDGQ